MSNEDKDQDIGDILTPLAMRKKVSKEAIGLVEFIKQFSPQEITNRRRKKEHEKLINKTAKLIDKRSLIEENIKLKDKNAELKDYMVQLKEDINALKLKEKGLEIEPDGERIKRLGKVFDEIKTKKTGSLEKPEEKKQLESKNRTNRTKKKGIDKITGFEQYSFLETIDKTDKAVEGKSNVINFEGKKEERAITQNEPPPKNIIFGKSDANHLFKMFNEDKSISLDELKGKIVGGRIFSEKAVNDFEKASKRLEKLAKEGYVELKDRRYHITDKGIEATNSVKKTYEFNNYDTNHVFKLIQENGGKINESSIEFNLAKEYKGEELKKTVDYDTYRIKEAAAHGFLNAENGVYSISEKGMAAWEEIKQDPDRKFIEEKIITTHRTEPEVLNNFKFTGTEKDLLVFNQVNTVDYETLNAANLNMDGEKVMENLLELRYEGYLEGEIGKDFTVTEMGRERIEELISGKSLDFKNSLNTPEDIKKARMEEQKKVSNINKDIKNMESQNKALNKNLGKVAAR